MKKLIQHVLKLTIIVLLLVPHSALAYIPMPHAQPPAQLEHLLNPDGTLNLTTGFSGSFGASGWQMLTDENGRPRFLPTGGTMGRNPAGKPLMPSGDEQWDSSFGLPGIDSTAVLSIVISGSDVYVGGYFTMAGGITATNIAKWDGSSWSALGNGVNSTVRAMVVSGTDLYVGGDFDGAIAKWNGTIWSSLGTGVGCCNGFVRALAVSGNNLYVGGSFSNVGGISTNGIAKWDGSTWSALGGGINNGTVSALAVSGSEVYMGGSFSAAGGISANRIAKWNGSSWSPLGSDSGLTGNGVNSIVNSLAISAHLTQRF